MIHVYSGQQPHSDHVKYFNFPRSQMDQTVLSLNTTAIAALEREKEEEEEEKKKKKEKAEVGKMQEEEEKGEGQVEEETAVQGGEEEEGDEEEEKHDKEKAMTLKSFRNDKGEFDEGKWVKFLKKKKQKQKAEALSRRLMLQGADSLVVACKNDPAQLVPRLLNFLNDGAAFAVYNDYLEVCMSSVIMIMMIMMCDS